MDLQKALFIRRNRSGERGIFMPEEKDAPGMNAADFRSLSRYVRLSLPLVEACC